MKKCSEKIARCDCTVIHADVVADVASKMPEEVILGGLADLYKNFSDMTRVKILWALRISEMCVCDLAALFGMTKSAISHQLKVLRMADLVRARRDGKVVYYSPSDSHVHAILEQGYEHVIE